MKSAVLLLVQKKWAAQDLKKFSDDSRRNISRSNIMLDSKSFRYVLHISAELGTILCSWGRFFPFSKMIQSNILKR